MKDVFFVLKGLLNGERGVEARKRGGDNEPFMQDGWYCFKGGDDAGDGDGPYRSRDDAEKELSRYTRTTEPGIVILGHEFRKLEKGDWESFAGASADTLISQGNGTILLWDPNDQTIEEHMVYENMTSLREEKEECRNWTFKVMI